MDKNKLFPDYVFETSWEVCNKVGGIYAVLSTRAKTLQDKIKDHVIFIGPDCWGEKVCPFFKEDNSLFPQWRSKVAGEGLKVKIGRWTVPGEPIAILVDYHPFFADKDRIYGQLWEDFQVDSLHAYGDYDDSLMFSYAAGKVVESFYNANIPAGKKRSLPRQRVADGRCRTVYPESVAPDWDYLHHPRYGHRPQHSRQQQTTLRLSQCI